MLRLFSRLFWWGIVCAIVVAGLAVWYALQPLSQRATVLDVEVARGGTMRDVARQISQQGIDVSPTFLVWAARLSGRANRMQAGNYRIEQGITPWGLIMLLSSGSTSYAQVAFIEGWNFRQLRAALDAMPDLNHDTLGLSDADVLAKLGMQDASPEGLFFPDTYFVSRGVSDLEVLRRAHEQLQKVLDREWAQRSPGLPVNTAYEGLTLASVIEKETGTAADRDKVASVFVNRLRIGMPLQSDPTVIYGIGVNFDGNLRRRDLQADNPYNSYTRRGLPPTPIAMPGLAAMRAAFNPARTDFLYFVSRGDGSSQFSRSLEEHNRAVARYQKGKGR
ncbi:endolytic transglycosylase MltG [Uliginosibacterium sp. H3]|uniref:Endolytic murein transglycosylase n=1 Tax=Uliginosibacterium silvisoli TaxID=3114758 RepID=A0ABU6K6A1_9RHOO|nr:endolytic transglycosylase MltG [Uliginosibacterium sp. H3]